MDRKELSRRSSKEFGGQQVERGSAVRPGAMLHVLGRISPQVMGMITTLGSAFKTTSEIVFWAPQSNKYPDMPK